ncbi:MAG: 2-C-methyl-D-erythritol 4-phosphate cytidylyltransferase [Clostridiaceae bacterium]|nr:2-C-methyl-D-erythritol 4-phosphate cytidylyltransferase [Clostridiaceae bacterium]
MSKVCAVIAAAGSGSRMGINFNKQFIEVKNKPLLYYTLNAFDKNSFVDNIIITAKEEEIAFIKEEIICKYKISKVSAIIPGGKERQDSVFNALKSLSGFDIVLIHDGARPFVTKEIIKSGIENAIKFGAAACGVRPKDTIKLKGENGFSCGTLNRDELFSVQTPQCFKYELIFQAHKKAFEQGIKYTDDTAVIENFGQNVYLYDGSYENIKITTPDDLIFANRIIEEKNLD